MSEKKTEMNQANINQMHAAQMQQTMGQYRTTQGFETQQGMNAEAMKPQRDNHVNNMADIHMQANPYMQMQPLHNMGANPYIQSQMTMSPPYQQGMNVQHSSAPQNSSLFGNISSDTFVKGALIGAAATVLLTNESVQKAVMKTFAKGTQMFQTGVEELKERFEDVKAEMEVEKNEA